MRLMDAREKLVELLMEFIEVDAWDNGEFIEKNIDFQKIASDLVAHGVTVQKCGYWISLTDCANAGVYCSVCNKKVYKEDYAWCNRKNKLRSDYCPHCGAKMMPYPPKGETNNA